MNENIKNFFINHKYFLLGIACIIAVGVVYLLQTNREPEIIRDGDIILPAAHEIPQAPPAAETPPEPAYITIHITGEVHNPGVFQLPYGSRINDAVQKAGGYTEYADLIRINLAAFLEDAMQIIIPYYGQELPAAPTPQGQAPQQAATGGLVNINTATSTELQTLPGVGPVIAQNIIDFREAHGNFASIEELIHVSRIGEVTLNNLRPLVTAD